LVDHYASKRLDREISGDRMNHIWFHNYPASRSRRKADRKALVAAHFITIVVGMGWT
jgi:hypothetical protein